MIKQKKSCYLNCVTQAQNVRFKSSRLSPRQNPREFWDLAQAYPLLPGRGSPTGEAASSRAVFSDDRLSLRCLADAGWHNACHRAQERPCTRYRHGARCHREKWPRCWLQRGQGNAGFGVHPPPARAPNLISLRQPVILVTGRENRFRVLCRCNILAGRGAGTL